MARAAVKLPLSSATRTINLKSLANVSDEFLLPEVRKFASNVALEENKSQVQIGNFPTRLQIDRRNILMSGDEGRRLLPGTGVTFVNFQKWIRFFYTDLETLADAVEYATVQLRDLMPWLSGDAWDTIYYWCENTKDPSQSIKTKTMARVRRWLSRQTSPLVNVQILGPTPEYRRTVIYNRRGAKGLLKWTKRSSAVSGGSNSFATARWRWAQRGGKVRTRYRPGRYQRTLQVQVAKAVNELVAQRVKRQFRDISSGYGFVRSREQLPIIHSAKWRPSGENIHIPRIWLGLKRIKRQRR